MVARTARQRATERWQRRNEPRREAGRRVHDYHGDGAYEPCLRALRALCRREYEKAGRAVEQAPAYKVKILTRKASSRRHRRTRWSATTRHEIRGSMRGSPPSRRRS